MTVAEGLLAGLAVILLGYASFWFFLDWRDKKNDRAAWEAFDREIDQIVRDRYLRDEEGRPE